MSVGVEADQFGFYATRTVVTDGLIVLFSAVLFGIHWRWVRRENALK